MSFLASFLAAALVTAPAAATVSPPAREASTIDGLIDYGKLAADFLERIGFDAAAGSEGVTLEQLFESSFAHGRIGLLDIALASPLTADKRAASRYLKTLVASVRLQKRWVELATGGDRSARDILKDAASIQNWLASVSGDELVAAGDSGGRDVIDLLKPKDAVRGALERFDSYMKAGTALGLERQGVTPEVVILAPGRRDFHELLGLFGWLSPELQGVYWHDGTIPWTNTYYYDVTVVALEFHTGDSAAGSVFQGIDANGRNPTAMEEQVMQLAANALITNIYGEKVPPALVGAMAINLIIDVFGECATRVDGDLRQRRTEAREVFIPGGQSEGGMLPPNFANSRFRGEEGKDRFVVPLKSCQSAGGTQAKQERKKGRNIHFQLWDDSQSGRYVISAPLLGTPAAAQPPLPPDYYADGAEFFRAYRTCFLYWLESNGGGSKKKSAAKYAALLDKLAVIDSASALEGAIEEVYELPLSSAKPGKKDLEGRFLTWLSRQ